jgi:hypothetical protein
MCAEPMPMRTEHDVRAALLALEDHAPSADAVLRAVGAARVRARRGPARAVNPPPSLGWPQLVMGIATAAAAAVLAFSLLPSLSPSVAVVGGRGVTPGGGLPSPASLSRAMLTAFVAATTDVVYMSVVTTRKNVIVASTQLWNWQAQPVVGQPARWRERDATLDARAAVPAPRLKPVADIGFSVASIASTNNLYGHLTADTVAGHLTADTVAGHLQAYSVYGHLTMVCYAGNAQPSCGYGGTRTPEGRWAVYPGAFAYSSVGVYLTAGLAQGIAEGEWRVTGRTYLAGQRAIALTKARAGSYRPAPATLWLNANTYLPLRMINGAGTSVVSQSWQYLEPTAANLAMLKVPVPNDYRRFR